ncbi:MAG TPA: response regulator [Acidisoma sp.]|jgi:DNA-binding response OmpR family regulator|uniref:response regulator n=1 Tax=Acidisoma sp. TaxID=1872115 RepID=UPI002B95EEC6|nr:response regulator [Acidisoma sp.]HTI01265.1 response regulator [Acidisoma sp.]
MSEIVLLVEDELFVALDIQATVEDAGFVVDGPYATLKETLEAIAGNACQRPACAILDVRLRDGEVYPAADLLRDAGMPIIFHSGHADQVMLEGRYPGAAFCGKPCSPAALRAKLVTLLAEGRP